MTETLHNYQEREAKEERRRLRKEATERFLALPLTDDDDLASQAITMLQTKMKEKHDCSDEHALDKAKAALRRMHV